MNYQRARKMAAKAFDLFNKGSHEEAHSIYQELIPLLDASHWATSSIHGEYSLVLRELGDDDGVLEQLELSLDSALRAEGSESSSAAVARHFLAEFYLQKNNIENALEVLTPGLERGGGVKWIVYYSTAKAYYLKNDLAQFEVHSQNTIGYAPKGKFKNVIEFKKHIKEVCERMAG